ncbi:unnamed protein product, partial [Pelagomonas calceolata]
ETQQHTYSEVPAPPVGRDPRGMSLVRRLEAVDAVPALQEIFGIARGHPLPGLLRRLLPRNLAHGAADAPALIKTPAVGLDVPHRVVQRLRGLGLPVQARFHPLRLLDPQIVDGLARVLRADVGQRLGDRRQPHKLVAAPLPPRILGRRVIDTPHGARRPFNKFAHELALFVQFLAVALVADQRGLQVVAPAHLRIQKAVAGPSYRRRRRRDALAVVPPPLALELAALLGQPCSPLLVEVEAGVDAVGWFRGGHEGDCPGVLHGMVRWGCLFRVPESLLVSYGTL